MKIPLEGSLQDVRADGLGVAIYRSLSALRMRGGASSVMNVSLNLWGKG